MKENDGISDRSSSQDQATFSPRRLWDSAVTLFRAVVGSDYTDPALPEPAVKRLCELAQSILEEEPNVRSIASPVVVVGDIHGQFQDLLEILATMGSAPERNYVFLGDFVDRGNQSLETIQLLVALKIRFPSQVTLLRGNHECRAVSQVFGFYDEIISKYGSPLVWAHFTELFDYLPLGCLIDGKIFCTHGGLSPALTALDDIKLLDRVGEVEHDGLITDLLWSDPCEEYGWGMSPRGAGYLFGPDVSQKFNHQNGLQLVCRAHQVVMEGYEWMHDKNVATVFSAPNYGGRMGNQGAAMSIDETLECTFRQFDSSRRSPNEALDRKLLDELLAEGIQWQPLVEGLPPYIASL